MNPLLYTDFYKTEHHKMYPEGTTLIYSNLTPRKSRIPGIDKVVVFGVQHFILQYLTDKFTRHFFALPKTQVIEEYKRHINVDSKHIEALHDLGYLPLEIKALPEGTLCPIGVPLLTIKNTHPDFYWLTNYVETLMSAMLWQPTTSATIAYEYKKLLSKYAKETTGSVDFVPWQGHDFSMRGMSSIESSILSGMGHLLSFTGTDTIPAIYQLEQSYGASGLIGASVPATEHSVMCMGIKENEIDTFSRLLKLYPTGILSIVSDTWDLWKVLTEILPKIKEQILARDGKLVIRPDSGNPVDILCGRDDLHKDTIGWYDKGGKAISEAERKGVIELLWDLFGGKINEYGYKELDFHIGAIYGDSITLDCARQICERLKAKGFASTNVVLGIGSYTYQHNTRDTFGFAMKATYGEVEMTGYPEGRSPEALEPSQWTERREIFKDPITDDGTKKSKKGLLRVGQHENGNLFVQDQCTWEQENTWLLQTVFKDGKLEKTTTLQEIRDRLASYG